LRASWRRSNGKVKVPTRLAKLGISDSDSSSSSEEGDRRRRRGAHGKKKRSGKTDKLTSKVLFRQIWPHSQLSLLFVSKDISYDNLTLTEFAAGYASILRLPGLSEAERSARIEHFANLMYFATQFPWPVVRKFHAAVLFEIECGRLRWGASMAHLETRLLHSNVVSRAQGSRESSETKSTVLFCRAFQTGKCTSSKDHYGFVRNERKWVQHICAKCWLEKQEVHRHREGSTECPFASSTVGTASSSSISGSS